MFAVGGLRGDMRSMAALGSAHTRLAAWQVGWAETRPEPKHGAHHALHSNP